MCLGMTTIPISWSNSLSFYLLSWLPQVLYENAETYTVSVCHCAFKTCFYIYILKLSTNFGILLHCNQLFRPFLILYLHVIIFGTDIFLTKEVVIILLNSQIYQKYKSTKFHSAMIPNMHEILVTKYPIHFCTGPAAPSMKLWKQWKEETVSSSYRIFLCENCWWNNDWPF